MRCRQEERATPPCPPCSACFQEPTNGMHRAGGRSLHGARHATKTEQPVCGFNAQGLSPPTRAPTHRTWWWCGCLMPFGAMLDGTFCAHDRLISHTLKPFQRVQRNVTNSRLPVRVGDRRPTVAKTSSEMARNALLAIVAALCLSGEHGDDMSATCLRQTSWRGRGRGSCRGLQSVCSRFHADSAFSTASLVQAAPPPTSFAPRP